MPSVGFVANGVVDETSDDVTPPSVLMEHPPLAVFVNGKFCWSLSPSHSPAHGNSTLKWNIEFIHHHVESNGHVLWWLYKSWYVICFNFLCRCFSGSEWAKTVRTIELEKCTCRGGGEGITSRFWLPSQIQCHADAAWKWVLSFPFTLPGIYWGKGPLEKGVFLSNSSNK